MHRNEKSMFNYKNCVFSPNKIFGIKHTFNRIVLNIKKKHHTLNSGMAFSTDGVFQMSYKKQVLIGICTLT